MSAARHHEFEATMPVDTRLHRITPIEPGAIVTDDEADRLYRSAYGYLRPITPPRVVPCSTVARWWLELRRLLG